MIQNRKIMKEQKTWGGHYEHPEMLTIPLLSSEPLCTSGMKESFIVDSDDSVEF